MHLIFFQYLSIYVTLSTSLIFSLIGSGNGMALRPTNKKVELRTTCSCVIAFISNIAFSALTLLLGQQDGHLACKN